MTQDTRTLCLNCAWRANCAKRFSMADGGTLHCPDYSEDVTLRKVKQQQDSPRVEED